MLSHPTLYVLPNDILKVCGALRREKDAVQNLRNNKLENKLKLIDRKPSNKVQLD